MKKSLLKFISKFSLLFCFLVLFPIIALADFIGPCPKGFYNDGKGCVPDSTVLYLMFQIHQIFNSIIPVLIALGVVYFVWGVVIYVVGDEEAAKKKGRDRMIWGIIGFAVIIGLWGLVLVLVNTFFPNSISAPSLAPLVGEDFTCTLVGNPDPTFKDLLCYITRIINDSVIPLIFALAVVVFVWGTVNFFILNSDDEKKREQGRQFMIWGIIALAVMLSVWGLVRILGGTFNFDTSVLPQVTPS